MPGGLKIYIPRVSGRSDRTGARRKDAIMPLNDVRSAGVIPDADVGIRGANKLNIADLFMMIVSAGGRGPGGEYALSRSDRRSFRIALCGRFGGGSQHGPPPCPAKKRSYLWTAPRFACSTVCAYRASTPARLRAGGFQALRRSARVSASTTRSRLFA